MNLVNKRIVGHAAVAVIGAIALATWWYLSRRGDDVRLSPRSEVAVPRMTLEIKPIYVQFDPKWADEKTGGSGEPLRAVGCTICCLSMALAQHGIMLDQSELNRKLKQADGFTEQGWIKWDVVKEVTARHASIELPRRPTHQDIDEALSAGCPVLVKVFLKPGVQHWVLVVGRDQNDYLMKDPLGHGESLGKLASLNSSIFAVRIVRKL